MSARKRRPRRRAELSQHFLKRDIASRLVQTTSISHSDLVIEIGPGRGALTKPLLKKTGRLIAVEFDNYLAERLQSEFGERAKVVESDFLTFPLPEENYSIVGNIPFNRSTDIIRRLSMADFPPMDAWLIVQRELAQRMCGPPFCDESLWSLRLKPRWHIEITDWLNRSAFNPPPAIDAALIHMKYRGRSLISQGDLVQYLELIEAAFRSNKPMGNALRSWLSKTQIRRLSDDLRFPDEAMPSDLIFEQWLGIFRYWKKTQSHQNR